MDNQKSLSKLFCKLFPYLSAVAYLLAFAVIFDTFSLDLHSAFYNLLLSLPLYGLMLLLTRQFYVAPLTSTIIAFILFYFDQYVLSARLTHIRFSDIKLIGQAARVANRYPLIWNMEIMRRLLIALLICSFVFFVYYYYKLKYSRKTAFFSGFGIILISSAIILSGIIPSAQEDFNFTRDADQRGLLYSWYCQAREGKLEAPKGYSKDSAKEILSKYTAIEGEEDVRVIVIMNESLADYSLIGKPSFEDPLPFIHSLVESGEAFEGKLAVSVFGGGTCNTEFEFLTGSSTAFLPEGCTPYLQYVDHEMDNLVSELGNISKIAVHPYYSEEWNRTQVYRFFGFDKFVSGVDFGSEIVTNGKDATSRPSENIVSFGEGPLYVRSLISDQTCFERIQEENADFTFAVTMQNHGGYEYIGDDFANRIYVTEEDRHEWTGMNNLVGMLYSVDSDHIEDEVYKVNQYLTLSSLSDQAFERLIGELGKDERRTIVLMFGDHQPGVLISEHYVDMDEGVDPDYTVPYILWANYDIEFDAPETVSTNYLSAVLKKNADLGLTAWDQFRLDMMDNYPVVTANNSLNANGNLVNRDVLRDYEIIQYMRLFEQ